jgi:hypothetical protein
MVQRDISNKQGVQAGMASESTVVSAVGVATNTICDVFVVFVYWYV